jgi:hypothetical protein
MKFPYQTVPEITEQTPPGFYRISHEAYHRGPGISSSAVKKALVSYDQFIAPHENSTALTFGRAFHAAILEPHEYLKMPRIAGGPGTNAYKAEVAAGRDIVCAADEGIIEEMALAIKAHPEYTALGAWDSEVMAVSRCKETGLLIKCKADLFGSGRIIDFKSTSGGATPPDFLHAVNTFDYHVSAAFYSDIIEGLLGVRLPFVWVPVTKSEPYECEFIEVSEALLDEGRKLYKAGLRRIAKWQKQDADARVKAEKKTWVLQPNGRTFYSTRERLEYLEPT